jgi:eukaryotic-like serine/threonine-protein kinase
LYAAAVIALAARAYPAACETFTRMRAADSLDAMAWFGLGDCLSLDSTVVREPSGTRAWRFRSSWHSAAKAYMRAAAIEPGVHRALAYATIEKLLPTATLQLRVGRPADSSTMYVVAHPSFVGDTVAYLPLTRAQLAAARADVDPPSEPEALRYNRDALVNFARRWTAAEPSNADAFEALSAGFESRGQLGTDAGGALGALRHARELAKASEQQLRLATIEVRLLFKREQLESARALADSILTAKMPPLSAPAAGRLAGLAAFTGRLGRAAELRTAATSAENAEVGVAPEITNVESRLVVRAAAGVCDDSLSVLRRSIGSLLESFSAPAHRDELRSRLLVRPMSLAFPCLGARAIDEVAAELPLDRAQRAYAVGNRRLTRLVLDSMVDARRIARPGDVSLDFTVQEAWLRAALGDTAAAERQLDLVLGALPTVGAWAVREVGQSAAVGRALELRAELAARRGDKATSRRRAGEVLVLWKHADSALTPTLDRMRALSSSR